MGFSMEMLRRELKTGGLDIRYVDETGSTNADLLADGSAGPGTVLIAGSQTAGRGRMGRAFSSPEGGLYMSVLFRPESAESALLLTPRAAVAAASAIEDVSGRRTEIKWVNDVLIDGKKCCGILAQARGGDVLSVVLGIGVNVTCVPQGLEDTACAVTDGQNEYARERIAAGILDALFAPQDGVYGEYVRRCTLPGREINVHRGERVYIARAVGIDRRFRLVVELPDGRREALDSGEVSVRTRD